MSTAIAVAAVFCWVIVGVAVAIANITASRRRIAEQAKRDEEAAYRHELALFQAALDGRRAAERHFRPPYPMPPPSGDGAVVKAVFFPEREEAPEEPPPEPLITYRAALPPKQEGLRPRLLRAVAAFRREWKRGRT